MKTQFAPTYTQNVQEALQDAWDAAYYLMGANLLWVLLSLPVVTAPGAAAGLFYAAHQLARRESVSTGLFFEGFRRYFWAGLRWLLANLLALGLLGLNFWFYGGVGAGWANLIQGLCLGLVVLWLLLQVYTFPLLLEQERPSLRQALRNSAVLLFKRPALSFGLIGLLLLAAVLSTVLPVLWLVIGASLIAFFASRFLLILLEEERK